MTLNSRSVPDQSSSSQVSVEVAALRLAIKCQHQYLFPDFDDSFFIATANNNNLVKQHGDSISVIPVVAKACDQCGENLHTSLRRLLRVTPDSYALQAWEAYVEFFKLNGNSNNLVHLHHDIEIMMEQLRILLNRPEGFLLRANSSFDPASDVLDRPTTASESSSLVLVTVGISKFLNSLFDLPRDSGLVNMELQEALDSIRKQHKDLKLHAVALLQSARFNFRWMANITTAVILSVLFGIRFIIYLSFGWLSIWQIVRNIAAPLVVTSALRMIEHWYQVESKHASSATDRGFVVWDHRTGKLTDYGKEMILQGNLECKKETIRFIGDELTLPCHTFEYTFLYNLSIRLSNFLNTRYHLPVDADTISLSWKLVLQSAWRDRRQRSPFETVFRSTRFNLRFLASKYFLSWGFVILSTSYLFLPFYFKVCVGLSMILLVTTFFLLEKRLRQNKH